jgi:hypothetical protein
MLGVDRAAEADPDGVDPLRPPTRDQGVCRLDDLVANPAGTRLGVDGPPFEVDQGAVASPEAELELRPADLDAEE